MLGHRDLGSFYYGVLGLFSCSFFCVVVVLGGFRFFVANNLLKAGTLPCGLRQQSIMAKCSACSIGKIYRNER